MDAHVFRVIADNILNLLHGARIEKIHSPFPDVIVFLCYHHGDKFRLILRSGKKNPSFFLSHAPLPNPEIPAAFVMRLRKYASGLRLGAGEIDSEKRCIRLPIWKKMVEQPFSLFLDIKKGAYISEKPFAVSPPAWPNEQDICKLCSKENRLTPQQTSSAPWMAYPLLTPLLRESLSFLALPDALALMVDLEAGGGNLFFYEDRSGKPALYTAWPLPQEVLARKELTEIYENDWYNSFTNSPYPDLERSSFIDERKLLDDFELTKKSFELAPQKKKETKQNKTLAKLDQEEKRLLAMVDLQKEAQAIQEILWQYPVEYKEKSITIHSLTENKEKYLTLDPRLTLRENMGAMFTKSAKGKRGLLILQRRRAELMNAKSIPLPQGEIKEFSKKTPSATSPHTNKTKQASSQKSNSLVAQFTSRDGYTLLRGKSAKGNQQILKMAQPYDYWLHTVDGPSAHVIIRRAHAVDEPPNTTLEEAANLVAEKSQYKNDLNVKVMICLVKHVHAIKGAPAGTVKVDKVYLQVHSKKHNR